MVIIAIILILISGLLFRLFEYREKSLASTLSINPDKITSMVVEGIKKDDAKAIKNKQVIAKFIQYLDQFQYKRKSEDSIDLDPPQKSFIIYLYQNEKIDFIVPYEKEIMISKKVYKIKGGKIDYQELLNILE